MKDKKLFDKLFARCLNGKSINVDKFDFTQEDVSYLFGAAKEYQREAEYFETYQPSIREAKKRYKRCERLEKLAAAIQKKLEEYTDLQSILDIETTDINGKDSTVRELLSKLNSEEKQKLRSMLGKFSKISLDIHVMS